VAHLRKALTDKTQRCIFLLAQSELGCVPHEVVAKLILTSNDASRKAQNPIARFKRRFSRKISLLFAL
jgi:hypothetical protein